MSQQFDHNGHHVKVTLDSTSYQIQGANVFALRSGNWVLLATFPALTYRTLLHYDPMVLRRYDRDSIPNSPDEWPQLSETDVEAACVLDGRIWVGLATYNSEGFEGLGGVAYWEPMTGAVGLLRHPALVDYSATDILVTKDTIYVKSVQQGELSSAVGNGLVAISRSNLKACARIPPGPQGLRNKDDPSVSNPTFELPLSQLITRRDFSSITVPNFNPADSLQILKLGADRFMEHVAAEERTVR